MKNKPNLTSRILTLILSFVIASTFFLSVSTIGDSEVKKWLSLSTSTEGVYVIEDINIDYRFDKTKYEVIPFTTQPYVVIKGDKQLINLLKLRGKPEFFIELSGKLPGTYQEKVDYTGINKSLTVEVYPSIIDLRLMEQQTVKFKPTINLINTDKLNPDFIASVPILDKEEVLIRDIQDKLNQVGKVEGVVDIKDFTETQIIDVTLQVYDREGNLMPNINLIDKHIRVTIPIERKVTIIKEEVINEIVVIEQPKEEKPPKPTEPDSKTEETKPTPPKQEGLLSFINIPTNLTVYNATTGIKWSSDVKIDLRGFTEGKYEMTINDNGTSKILKFDLRDETTKPNDENSTDSETSKKSEEEEKTSGGTETKNDTETEEKDEDPSGNE